MAEFDADKLSELLEQLNREQLATVEKRLEKLLSEIKESSPASVRSDQTRLAPDDKRD